jgi:hypothetical protein
MLSNEDFSHAYMVLAQGRKELLGSLRLPTTTLGRKASSSSCQICAVVHLTLRLEAASYTPHISTILSLLVPLCNTGLGSEPSESVPGW